MTAPVDSNSQSPDDAQVVLKLLVEYTVRLREEMELWDRQLYRIYGLTGVTFVALVTGILVYTFVIPQDLKNSATATVVVLVLMVVLISALLWTVYAANRRFELMREEARVTALQLQRLVRIALPMSEHLERDFGRRLELELRAAEVDAILRYADRRLGGQVTSS